MKQNIFFLIIDSFRADKFFSKSKTSITPEIDYLIKNGTYFENAISSADGTILSWSSIFTSNYPFKTGIRSSRFNKLNDDVTTYFDMMEKYNYKFYGYLPVLSDTVGLFPNFENDDCFYDFFLGLSNGLGDKIIDKLQSLNKQESWFFLIHAMDLHPPILVSKEFDNEKFGKNYYEKKVSEVDFWIGKILRSLDLNNTIVIITADHGSYIQSFELNNKHVSTNPNAFLQIMTSKLANKIPQRLHPLKEKLFFLREKVNQNKKKKLTQHSNLLPHQKRALLTGPLEKDHFLFDDKIRIPLLFIGKNIPKSNIVFNQVRNVDIFPTLAELTEIGRIQNTDGRSLKPLMENKPLSDEPAYIESNPLVVQESNDVIGIRTSEFKYFRDKNNTQKRIHLYDLLNDPFEDENIFEKYPIKVKEMEQILQNIIASMSKNNVVEDDEVSEDIARELRKLGYL